jgi:uncharacterized repeat protein (TIGR03803 family)
MKEWVMRYFRNFVDSCHVALLLNLWLAPVQAQTIQQLYGFGCDSKSNVCSEGKIPNSLFQSADGNFYGTTFGGGAGNNASGTVFQITAAGQLTTLFTFVADQHGNFSDGAFPTSLVEGNDGFLYGTNGGGSGNSGIVFKLSKNGTIQILHGLCSVCGEGSTPFGLILGQDGNFYGFSLGKLFRVAPSGTFTVLHTFNSATEGPTGLGLTQAEDGNFYGTTQGGQTIFTTLFRLTPAGRFTILHSFHYADFPTSGPIQASDQKLYGVRSGGIFDSSLSGSGFQELTLSGLNLGTVIQGSDLNLWSLTPSNTAFPQGAIRVISTAGSLLQTISFNGANGSLPVAPLVQSNDGTMVGVAEEGGSVSQGNTASGVVFSVDAGLAPPKPTILNFSPSAGKIGSSVTIHGSHFIGSTQVSFNGVNASFQLLNNGNITVTVPTGATTGPITVTNPGGPANSSKNFTVQ